MPRRQVEFRKHQHDRRKIEPPVVGGKVCIVTMGGFDAQACGGTHVHSTAEIGLARLVKFDNKGKDNKRFYWELAPARPNA